jgi:hypothetical protein
LKAPSRNASASNRRRKRKRHDLEPLGAQEERATHEIA